MHLRHNISASLQFSGTSCSKPRDASSYSSGLESRKHGPIVRPAYHQRPSPPSFCLTDVHLVHPGLVSKRLKNLPVLGSVHGSDLQYTYGPGELRDYLIHFATHLDPNGGSSHPWPQYTTASPKIMTLLTPNGSNITQDTYRADGLKFITQLTLAQSI
jgi:hypothetical protein